MKVCDRHPPAQVLLPNEAECPICTEVSLARDRALLGVSVESHLGKALERIDPRRILLFSDGTYRLLSVN